MWGAEAINAPRGTKTEFGIVRPGMLADLVFVIKIRGGRESEGALRHRWMRVTTPRAPSLASANQVCDEGGILYDGRSCCTSGSDGAKRQGRRVKK